tara:strand:- start:315 stop:629 length:315 start_codon:yes stop_codon:yes gene_type:complete
MMKVSECCGASADSSIEDGIGICSDCKEWADFEEEKEEKEEKMKDRYEIHFGLAYDKSAGGIDKRYHRVRKYDTFKGASRCLSRANRCKWIEWTDFVDKKEHLK